MKTGISYINTTEKAQMSYFQAIPGYFCNISRPLRDEDFTIDLTQGEKFFGVF